MLWSWGDNGASQLGLDHTPSRRVCSPQRVSADSFKANLISVVAGDAHCLALDELGGVYVWGRTREGQAGRLSVEPVGTPVFLQALAHEHIKKIACGSDVSYALSASGVLYQFGAVHAPSEQLAHADLAGYGRALGELSERDQNMLRVSLASYLAAGDESDDDDNDATENADGVDSEAVVGSKRVLSPEPSRVNIPDGERVTSMAGGFGFCVAALAGGGAVAFGLNDRFQCGHNDRLTRDVPLRIGSLGRKQLIAVACGQQHACVVDEHGQCYTWGMGAFGQLGHGRRRDEPRPRHVMLLGEAGPVCAVACGQQHTAFLLRVKAPDQRKRRSMEDHHNAMAAAITEEQRRHLWFSGVDVDSLDGPELADAGRFILSEEQRRHLQRSGVDVGMLDGSYGDAGDAAGDADGEESAPPPSRQLFGCGHAEYGQLGTGDVGGSGEAARDFPLPRRIPLPASLQGEPTDVRCGALHTAVITSRGELASFGWGSSGALGHGGFGYELLARPVEALGRQEIVAVAVGGRHTVALESVTSSSALLARDYGALLTSGIDADVIIEAGLASTGGSRRFLCHKALLACRCPRILAMMAMESRFVRGSSDEGPLEASPLHWSTQADGFARMASDPSFYNVALRLPSIRAPIFALLLRWIYTQRVDTVEPLFLSQLSRAARKLRMPALEQACQPNASSSPLPATLPSCLQWLLNDGAYAEDVKLIAIDGSLYASRALLCCRCEYIRTLLHGSLPLLAEGDAEGVVSIDLRPFGTSLDVLHPLLKYAYTGSIVTVTCDSNGGDLEHLDPALALAILPHASALLMEDLKRLCEAVLVAVCDEQNAAALLTAAEACFAERLRTCCAELLS